MQFLFRDDRSWVDTPDGEDSSILDGRELLGIDCSPIDVTAHPVTEDTQ